MLDIKMYRNLENIAKSLNDSYLEDAKHFPEAFTRGNFPFKVENSAQLLKLCNWNHDGILKSYLDLLSGLNKNDFDIFVKTIDKFLEFQATFFNYHNKYLAIEQFLKAFTIYKILDKLDVLENKNILEIGPGTGFNIFFIGEHSRHYATVEVAESFYLLQDMINSFLLKEKFHNCIWDGFEHYGKYYMCKNQEKIIKPTFLWQEKHYKVFQYPYWKINEIRNNDLKYDVIMSNANLLEFTPMAFEDYLELFKIKLSKDGIFLFFCTGNPTFGTPDTLVEKLIEKKFKPLCLFRPEPGRRSLLDFDEMSEPVVFSAYGDLLKNYLTKYRNKYKKIYILDDNKTGLFLDKYEFITKKDLKKKGIKKGFIIHEKEDIRNVFSKIFKDLNIINLFEQDTIPSFKQYFGIFIAEKHYLYDKIEYNRERYNSYIYKEFRYFLEIFSKEKNKKIRSEDELIDMIKNYIEKNRKNDF